MLFSKARINRKSGCAKKTHPLGMEDGSIPDSSITASSQYSQQYAPYYGRLNNQRVSGIHWGAWAAKTVRKAEHLQVDLGRVTWITHVATQGRPIGNNDQWVSEYSVEYSLRGDQWQSYQDGNGVTKIFPGNSDRTTVVKNEFSPFIKARFVRVVVQAWYDHITMRAEFYGCAA
ncbi:lactadherin isoform X2 [Nematostella vectensis]|nr:lactadherin isoform X2 [Nematostella vectensis]